MKLPEIFLENMREWLGEKQFCEFLNSLNWERFYGLKINTLKISPSDFKRIFPQAKEPVPWAKDGFYFSPLDNPTHNPLYNLGLYYIQEPSAMLPATILSPSPDDKVLDLCASPGGKTLQLACSMENRGLLVSNDISEKRIKPLVKNIEFYGIKNCVVTNESPQNLANKFPNFFDKILVDAPCSGEGMFKKDKDAAKSYEKYSMDICTKMQREILHYANLMLKEGGMMVYSTCTFNPFENEIMIHNFSKEYGYEFVEIPKKLGIETGRADWCFDNNEITKTARIWPHRAKGEGHFVACLIKEKATNDDIISTKDNKTFPEDNKASWGNQSNQLKGDYNLHKSKKNSKIKNNKTEKYPKKDEVSEFSFEEVLEAFRLFEEENLNIKLKGEFFNNERNLYFLPKIKVDLDNLKVAKYGFFLGQYADSKFELAHSFLLSLKGKDVKNTISLDKDSILFEKYIKGETLILENSQLEHIKSENKSILVALFVEDYPIGWGKLSGNILKNLYPKGWRR